MGFCLFVVSAGCSSSSPSNPGGNGADGDAGSGEFYASGSFTTTGTNAASATITGFQCSLTSILTPASAYEFTIAASMGDGSTATFSAPSGTTAYTLDSSVIFPAAPTSGMMITSSASCGATSFSYGTTAKPFEYDFSSEVLGADCSTVTAAVTGSSWTLTLTSVAAVAGDVGSVYTAHGAFLATMPDGMGNTGTLKLTF